jgi:AcrR family transcriptional regulator/DNA-binding MarR family transcriptional regulator
VSSSQADDVRRGRANSAAGPARFQLTDLHRARIHCATAVTLSERGYAGTTVAQVVEAAKVSRSRFYELFRSCDDCIASLLDELAAYVSRELRARQVVELPWEERVREGLWVILSCLEQQPLLAEACVQHAAGAAGEAAARREEIIAALVREVDAGRDEPGPVQASPMTAEGVVGAAVRVVYSSLTSGAGGPAMTDLFRELTGLILLPYLGPAGTSLIQARPTPERLAFTEPSPLDAALDETLDGRDPLKGITMRLTHRTALALTAVAQNPGATNRMVADHAGIADPGQSSKLLARLERLGLIRNESVTETKWELNSWALTPAGRRVVQLFGTRTEEVRPAYQPVPVLVHSEAS